MARCPAAEVAMGVVAQGAAAQGAAVLAQGAVALGAVVVAQGAVVLGPVDLAHRSMGRLSDRSEDKACPCSSEYAVNAAYIAKYLSNQPLGWVQQPKLAGTPWAHLGRVHIRVAHHWAAGVACAGRDVRIDCEACCHRQRRGGGAGGGRREKQKDGQRRRGVRLHCGLRLGCAAAAGAGPLDGACDLHGCKWTCRAELTSSRAPPRPSDRSRSTSHGTQVPCAALAREDRARAAARSSIELLPGAPRAALRARCSCASEIKRAALCYDRARAYLGRTGTAVPGTRVQLLY
eukprot:SAG31_NODE_1023_length_10298_cov_3.003530_4_plen_290_part_00